MSDEDKGGELTPLPEMIYSASDLVEEYSKYYLLEIFRNHIPSEIDGFKTIFRRYIFSLYLAHLTNGIMKSSRSVTELQDAHPYNDSSMYEVIMRMAQPWIFNPPLVISTSNIGTYSGNPTAALRYTSSGMAAYTREMYLDGIDVGAIPKVEGASLDLEPQYLIPAIPTALTMDNLTIGYGKGCLTARLNFGNVCDLVSAYAEHQSKDKINPFPYKDYASYFLPDFPTPCVITNHEQLLKAYAQGEYRLPINMDGKVVITKDKITVQSLPHGLPFLSADEALKDYLIANRNGPLDRKIKQFNAPRNKLLLGNLTITPRQGVSTLELWKDIAPIIRFSGRFHPNPNYTLKNGYVAKIDYPVILTRWYKERHALVLSTKRRKLQQLSRLKWIAEAHLVVTRHTDECLDIIRSSHDEAEALTRFAERFNLTPFQGRELLNQNLRVLAKTSGAKLLEKIEQLNNQINDLNISFQSVYKEISHTAQVFKKKYEKGRISHLPHYIGYIAFETGNVLFENTEEISQILEDFQKESCKIYSLEEGDYTLIINENGKVAKGDLHKYQYGDVYRFKESPLKTPLCTVRFDAGGVCFSKGISPCRRNDLTTYTTEDVWAYTRSGKIKRDSLEHLMSKRKNALTASGAKNDIVHVHSRTDQPVYMAQFNSTMPNQLHIQKLTPQTHRYVTIPSGDIAYFTHTGEGDWYFVPPEDYLHRCTVRVIHIPHPSTLFEEGVTQLTYDLNGKTNRNKGIRLY